MGRTTSNESEKLVKLHHVFYKVDKEFKDKIENYKKAMWLFKNNPGVRKRRTEGLHDAIYGGDNITMSIIIDKTFVSSVPQGHYMDYGMMNCCLSW